MDVKLVGGALQFHGDELLQSLNDEQGEAPSSNVMSYLQRWRPSEPEIKDAAFQRNLCGFIARKSDLLFRPLAEEEKNRQQNLEAIDDAFAIMPPLETFMNIPTFLRREQFWKSLQVNDCVTGVVSSIVDQGLRLTLLCVDKGVCREIDDLDIAAFCPTKELPKLYAKESALDAFQKRDIVRGIVLSVVEETERIIISLKADSVPDEKSYPRIGLITEDDFPVHYRRQSQIQDMSYEEMLQSILGFNNTGNVSALTRQLQIPTSASYFRFFSRLNIPEKEYAEGLKKWQSQKLAHHSVVQGVEIFKKGDYVEAMQHLNRALQIDAENVEALVARGALFVLEIKKLYKRKTCHKKQTKNLRERYANKESFVSAIKDFEEALSLNPKHNNARNYLIETLLTVGKVCEERRDLSQTVTHYESVLKVEADHKEATELLKGCRQLMAESKEDDDKERQPAAAESCEEEESPNKVKAAPASLLKTSTEKLKALIREDKDKERKSRSAKKEKRRYSESSSSSREAKKRKSKKKRRTNRSSSRSSSSSATSRSSHRSSRSRSSSSASSHKPRKKKKGKDKKRRKTKRSRKNSSSSRKREKPRMEESPKEEEESKKRDGKNAKEDFKGKDSPGAGVQKLTPEDSEKEALFYTKTAAASFLPVSSYDFFSKTSAIPGLGSPPPSHLPASAPHQDALKRSTLLRDSPLQVKNSPEGRRGMPDVGRKSHSGSCSPQTAGARYRNRSETSQEKGGGFKSSSSQQYGRDLENVRDDFKSYRNDSSRGREGDGTRGQLGRQVQIQDHLVTRQDGVLQAERERFYKEKKEEGRAYRRFRASGSRSSSSHSSRSRSGSLSRQNRRRGSRDFVKRNGRSADRTRSWTRSRSRSPIPPTKMTSRSRAEPSHEKSPTVTGVKELDRYLGGAKFLIQKAIEGKGYASWKELKPEGRTSRSPLTRQKSSKSPPVRQMRRSRSFSSEKEKSRSSPKRMSSRSPSPKGLKPRSPLRGIGSRSPRPEKQYMGSPSPGGVRSRSPKKWSETSAPSQKRSRSPLPIQSKKVFPLKHRESDSPQNQSSRSPASTNWSVKATGSRWDSRDRVDTVRTTQESKRSFTPEGSGVYGIYGRWDRSESKSPHERREPETKRDRSPPHVTSSFGKFGPPVKHVEVTAKPGLAVVKNDLRGNVSKSSSRLTETGRDVQTEKDTVRGGKGFKVEKSTTKEDSFSFMPRILRKPKMDGPDVNKRLVSSNQLEREKKLQQEKMAKEDRKKSGDTKFSSQEKGESQIRNGDKTSKSEERKGSKNSKEDEKVRGSRLDKEGKLEVRSKNDRKEQGDEETKKLLIAKMANSKMGEIDKKSLEDELEREIERRVQERLKQQERSSVGSRKTGSRTPSPHRSSREGKKRKNSSSDDERDYKKGGENLRGKHDGKDDRHRWESRGRKRGRSGSDRDGSPGKVKEVQDGWSRDSYGYSYFAEHGKLLNVGMNFDLHGNKFFVKRDRSKPGGAPRGLDKRWDSRLSRFVPRSRSRSRDRSSSRSRSRSSERSGSKRSQTSIGNRSTFEGKQSRMADGGQEKTSPLRSRSSGKSGEEAAVAEEGETRGLQSTAREGERDETTAARGSAPDEVETLPRSRWDAVSKSRWDEGEEDRKAKAGSASRKQRSDSLSELEKFLLDLKQQKKKQWIAEGKLKEN